MGSHRRFGNRRDRRRPGAERRDFVTRRSFADHEGAERVACICATDSALSRSATTSAQPTAASAVRITKR